MSSPFTEEEKAFLKEIRERPLTATLSPDDPEYERYLELLARGKNGENGYIELRWIE